MTRLQLIKKVRKLVGQRDQITIFVDESSVEYSHMDGIEGTVRLCLVDMNRGEDDRCFFGETRPTAKECYAAFLEYCNEHPELVQP